MIRSAVIATLAGWLFLWAGPGLSQDRVTLGWGRLLNNDVLGDLRDRWQTGSYAVSLLRGPAWTGALPDRLGDLLEYRFSGAIMAAADLDSPAPDDRRFVGSLALGVYSHATWAGMQTSLGMDLVVLGPQTGLGRFQSWLHRLLGDRRISDLSGQLGNAVVPTLQAEVRRVVVLDDRMTVVPFVAAKAGVENLVRVGGDMVIGNFGQGGYLLRDDTTGQRYRGIAGTGGSAMSLTLGGDVAHVFGSDYLPNGGGAVATATRARLRAGLAWQGQRSSAFYGVTYLTPEFDSQPEGQLVGSVNLNLRF